jgi:hypothetical protein
VICLRQFVICLVCFRQQVGTVNVSGGVPSGNQLSLGQLVHNVEEELVEVVAAPVQDLGKALAPQTLKAPLGVSGKVMVHTWLMECFRLHYFRHANISLTKRIKDCGYPSCVSAKKFSHRNVMSLVDNVVLKTERDYFAVLHSQKIPPSDRHLQALFQDLENRCMAKMLVFEGIDPNLIFEAIEKPSGKKTRAEKLAEKGKSVAAAVRNPSSKKVVASVHALGMRVRTYKIKIREARKDESTGDPCNVELIEYEDYLKLEKQMLAERPADQSALTQFFPVGKKKKKKDSASADAEVEQEEAEEQQVEEDAADGEEEEVVADD